MATACIPQVTFQGEGFAKAVVARFDTPHASSDGGAILLKSVDTRLGLTKRLAGCLVDERQPGKIRHQTLELIRRRVFGIACGTPTATTPRGSRTTRSTSCWWSAIRSPAPPWPRSPRSDERRGETFCKEDGGEG